MDVCAGERAVRVAQKGKLDIGNRANLATAHTAAWPPSPVPLCARGRTPAAGRQDGRLRLGKRGVEQAGSGPAQGCRWLAEVEC